jgi:16S rRNA (cytosine1402-N4)-methyltransferase
MSHTPVMLKEVIESLSPKAGEVHLDCTFGAGGYSKAILEKDAKLIAIDRDPNVIKFAEKLASEYDKNFEFININFADLDESQLKVNGIVLDLGVSSMQLDTAERGFSFMRDGDLDMRMGNHGLSAKDFVNNAKEEELARVIYEYGDEPASRKIARSIVLARVEKPISTTFELANIVRRAIGRPPGKIDLATKTFQAIRIYVNGELDALERFLEKSESLLLENGRIVVVTFHSLEDRIVKQYFAKNTAKKVARSKYSKLPEDTGATYKLLYKKPLVPSDQEVRINPRSRSAKLRAAIKIGGKNV